MDNPYFLPALEEGQHPVTYTDEAHDAVEEARNLKPDSEILIRLERIEKDLGKALDVIAQLEALIARIAPVLDQLAENPAKFLMSVMGGGKSGR